MMLSWAFPGTSSFRAFAAGQVDEPTPFREPVSADDSTALCIAGIARLIASESIVKMGAYHSVSREYSEGYGLLEVRWLKAKGLRMDSCLRMGMNDDWIDLQSVKVLAPPWIPPHTHAIDRTGLGLGLGDILLMHLTLGLVQGNAWAN